MDVKSVNEFINSLKEMESLEDKISRIDAKIFIQKSLKLIETKCDLLEQKLNEYSNFCGQEINDFLEIKEIEKSYKNKLFRLYKEYYTQFSASQVQFVSSRVDKRFYIAKYQEMILEDRNNLKQSKEKLLNKIKKHDYLIKISKEKMEDCYLKFEKNVNEKFSIENELHLQINKGFINKIFSSFRKIFQGKSKFEKMLRMQKDLIENIKIDEILENEKQETIIFLATNEAILKM